VLFIFKNTFKLFITLQLSSMMQMAKAIEILIACILLCHTTQLFSQETLIIEDDKLVIHQILISGNDVTHEKIILRELTFSTGDTVLKMQLLPALQRSKDNLLNLALFNFVNFEIKHLVNNHIDVLITVVERWYIWPVPILEYAGRNLSTFIENQDWDKINYGAWIKWKNFRGRNELLTGKIRLGYIKDFALSYSKPNMGKKQTHGISAGFGLNQQNEVYIGTVNNKPVEYMPQEHPAQTRFGAFAKYTYRRKYYTQHSLRFDFYGYNVADSVAIVNSNYLGSGDTRLSYFLFTYQFDYDVRDSKVYPLEGFRFNIKAEQVGLGIVPDFNYETLILTGILMYHQKIANRFYFYNATKAKYSSEKMMPYLLNKALGYNEYLSGYEPYVIDGSDYVLSLYNLKLEVVKPNSYTLPFLKMKQFNKIHYAVYFNLFAHAGYVNNVFPNPTNTMVNTWQFSAGAGIDLVTYYDQVIRFDYSINRYGEHGFFIHLETPFALW
jgi:outer membrane protein assembly factor BamA